MHVFCLVSVVLLLLLQNTDGLRLYRERVFFRAMQSLTAKERM